MLYLLLQLGEDRYALEARGIVEVLPLLRIKQIPQAPPGVAGAINYRGAPVPVIDLSELALGRPALRRLSTRIVLVEWSGANRLGLIAERATETLRCEPSEFADAGIGAETAPYLGPVVADARGLIQRVEVEQLLPPSLRAALFAAVAEQ